MQVLPAALAFGVSGVAGKLLSKKKAVAAPAAVPIPTRNAAAEAVAKGDMLARRRGVAANLILGASGAESSAGKTALGS